MHTIKEEKLSLSYYLFFTAVVLVYLNFLRIGYDNNGEIIPYLIRMFLYLSGPIFLILSLIVALLEGQHKRIKKHYWAWILIVHSCLLVLLINGVLIHQNNLRLITFDLLLYIFFLPGILIGAKEMNWKGLDTLFLSIFFLNSLLLIPYVGSFTNIAEQIRSSITGAYGQVPYNLWGGLVCWPYFLLTMKDRPPYAKVMTTIGMGIYLLFALIFLKRAPIVYLFLFSVLLLYSNRFRLNIKVNFNKFFFLISSIVLIVSIFQFIQVSPLVERLYDRFYVSGSFLSTVTKNNRILYDVGLVATQLSPLELIMGNGFGGTVIDTGNHYPDETTHSLHNFMALAVMKGGFLFFAIWYYGWLMFIFDFLRNKDRDNDKYFIPILITLLVSWFFGFINASVPWLLAVMGAGKIMAKRGPS